MIDGIASIVPVKVVKRDGDQVALYSANGGVLLDGRVYALELHAGAERGDAGNDAGRAARRADAGPGRRERAGGDRRRGSGTGLLDGGTLGALFEVRDRIVPEVDAEMDRYANDLIERFRDLMPASALDASGEGFSSMAGRGRFSASPGGWRSTPRSIRRGRRRGLAAA